LRIWTWIAAPLVLLTLFYLVLSAVHRHGVFSLENRNTAIDLLPLMTANIEVADTKLSLFDPLGEDTAMAMQSVGDYIDATAEACGLTVGSVGLQEQGESGGSGLVFLQATIEGQAELPGLMRFYNELHAPRRLVVVDSLKIAGTDLTEHTVYKVHTVCRFGFLVE